MTCLCCPILGIGQTKTFTHEDTLRGSITPERAWWDLTFYDLKLKVNPTDKSISGSNTIHYSVLKSANKLQIDLQPPLSISSISQDGKVLTYKKDGSNAYIVDLVAPQVVGSRKSITVAYSGVPKVAVHAPWDGGFSWSTDKLGNAFVATSCQGLGASVWWPCKDHMYDEVDSMAISVNVPKGFADISNGQLRRVTKGKKRSVTYEWFVKNQINNYGVNVNIARYVKFEEVYKGEKGDLALSYYVLPEDLAKAKEQFKQVPMMLKAFEHWFGPYPFYEDGYKLVQVPYLGMEHQSSVTYGNGFKNGYLGSDLSGTGWGLKWDYIIVHESGHEWFANSITYKDIADMWIHEGFTDYSESLFVEYYYGKPAAAEYVRGLRKQIQNFAPIIGKYDVNNEGSGDMYFKGANLLHTIRQIVNDDEKWRQILRGLNKDFYHQTVTTKQIEDYMTDKAGIDLSKVFDQYLRNIEVPTLEYYFVNKTLFYRWTNCVEGFNMPIKVNLNATESVFLKSKKEWQSLETPLVDVDGFKVDVDFYVKSVRKN